MMYYIRVYVYIYMYISNSKCTYTYTYTHVSSLFMIPYNSLCMCHNFIYYGHIRRCTCLQRHAWDHPVRMRPAVGFFMFDVYREQCYAKHMWLYIYIYMYTHMYIHLQLYLQLCMCIYIYMYIFVFLYIYTWYTNIITYVHDISLRMIYTYVFIIISWDSGHRLWFHLSLDVNAQQPGPVDIVEASKVFIYFGNGKILLLLTPRTSQKKSGEHSEHLSFKSTNCTRLCIQISAAARLCFPFLVSLT